MDIEEIQPLQILPKYQSPPKKKEWGTIYIGGKLSEMDFIEDDFIGMIQFIETRKKSECTNRGKRDPADFPLRICFTRIRTGILQSASL